MGQFFTHKERVTGGITSFGGVELTQGSLEDGE